MNRREVAELIEDALRKNQSYKISLMAKDKVAQCVAQLQSELAKNFGITITKDHNGAWGPMGKVRVTLRTYLPGDNEDLITFSLSLDSISSYADDEAAHADKIATPQ